MLIHGNAVEYNGKLICTGYDTTCDNLGDCESCLLNYKVAYELERSKTAELQQQNEHLLHRLHMSKRDNRTNRDRLRRQNENLMYRLEETFMLYRKELQKNIGKPKENIW